MSTAEPEPTEADRGAEETEKAERHTAETAARPRESLLPSPVFVALLGVAALGGWLAWDRIEVGPFLLVIGGWLACVALHEFAHAALAHRFGDRGLRGQGYLSLNPLRYGDRFSGAVLPVAFVLMSGIGVTGPATYLDHSAVPGRMRRLLVTAAGPLTSLLLAVGLCAAVVVLVGEGITDSWFWAALLYLAFLNASAAAISLLPLPGLDGFGAVTALLPARLRRVSPLVGVFGTVAVLGVVAFPPVNQAVFELGSRVFAAAGVNPLLLGLGNAVFPFWQA